MIISTAEDDFITKLGYGRTRPDLQSILRAITYYVSDDLIEDLLTRTVSDDEAGILTGMISNLVINGRDPSKLTCAPVGTLSELPQWVLPMAIASNRNVITDTQPNADDQAVFTRNAVTVNVGEEAAAEWCYQKMNGNRVIDSWHLSDNGRMRPRNIFGAHFMTASEILVYDCYYNNSVVSMLEDILSFASSQSGPRDISLTLYTNCSSKNSNEDESLRIQYERDLRSALRPHVVSTGPIHVCHIEKPVSGPPLHDRYIQIDNNSTFLLTAGCDCFFLNNGTLNNRACSVFLFTLLPGSNRLSFSYKRTCLGGAMSGFIML